MMKYVTTEFEDPDGAGDASVHVIAIHIGFRLMQAAQRKPAANGNPTPRMLTAAIKSEIAVSASNGGKRGRYQQLVYDYLMSIPPSSVEAERAFSAAGTSLCTKVRYRLSDSSIDTLCFLRAHYRS